MVLLIKICLQPAGVCVKTFSRFNVSFRVESIEKCDFEEAEERKENIAFFDFLYRVPFFQYDCVRDEISFL